MSAEELSEAFEAHAQLVVPLLDEAGRDCGYCRCYQKDYRDSEVGHDLSLVVGKERQKDLRNGKASICTFERLASFTYNASEHLHHPWNTARRCHQPSSLAA